MSSTVVQHRVPETFAEERVAVHDDVPVFEQKAVDSGKLDLTPIVALGVSAEQSYGFNGVLGRHGMGKLIPAL